MKIRLGKKFPRHIMSGDIIEENVHDTLRRKPRLKKRYIGKNKRVGK